MVELQQKEIWKDVVGYEGLYQVSNLGRVKSCVHFTHKKDIILKENIKNGGYVYVNLYKNHKGTKFYVHRLVANAFLTQYNDRQYVNHIDCNKRNNNVENLEYCTQKENIDHSWKNNLQKRRYKTFVNGIEYKSMQNASEMLLGNTFGIKELRNKFGNEFICNGKQIKVVMNK